METWLLIVIIAASVLVVGVVVWFLFLRSKDEAAVQVVDLGEVGELSLAVGEVAYGTLTVSTVEDASVLVGACDVLEIEEVTADDLPAAEEEEAEEEEAEEEEEEERRLREEDEEEAAETTTFYYSLTGKEAGECDLLMVYTTEELDEEAEDGLQALADSEDAQSATVSVTVTEAEAEEGAEEEEGEEEEEAEEEEE